MCNLQARYSSPVRCSVEVKIATDSLPLANVKSLTENFISMPYLKVQMYTVSLLWHIKQIVLYKTVFSLVYSKPEFLYFIFTSFAYQLRWDTVALFCLRLKNRIWDEEQKKAGELAGCRVNLQAVKNWIALRDKELDSMEPIGNDLQTLTRQKEDMKVHPIIIRFWETAHLPLP